MTGQSQQHGAIGGMAESSEGQRSVKIHLHAFNLIEKTCFQEFPNEAAGRAHWSHGVRTGGADADLVKVEEAGGHESIVDLDWVGGPDTNRRSFLRPVGAVECSVLDGFGKVGNGEMLDAFEIGDGARDFENAIVGAGGESLLLHGPFQEAFGIGV